MNLDLTTRRVGKDTVLSAGGEIDLSTAGTLRDRLRSVQDDGPNTVVLDLTEVEFIDSTGLSVLVDGAHDARVAGRGFGVVADGHLRALLHLTGLDTVMEVHPHLPDALRQTDLLGENVEAPSA